jgi:uncharacterized protein (TIGR03066 family)
MKKLLLSVFVMSLLLMTACKSDPAAKLLGTWEMESVEGEELSATEKSITMTFEKEGKFIQKSSQNSREGTYEVSKDGKTITLKPSEGKAEEMKSVELKGNKMMFKDGDKTATITLKKK